MTLLEGGTHADRAVLIQLLKERDGDHCMHPSCGKALDFSLVDGPNMVTIDHRFPQVRAREAGWTEDEIWALTNLNLMHRSCNARKGDRVYNDDGTLPEPPSRHKAVDKTHRPMVCDLCESGRLLFDGEVCELCGSGPQPATAPRYLRVKPSECSHGWGENPEQFCWMCFIGMIERKPATQRILEGP